MKNVSRKFSVFSVLLFFMGVNGCKASSIPALDKILINIRASISIEVDHKMIKFQFWLDCPFDTCRILVCPGQISNAEHCKWDLNQDIVQRVTLQSFEFQRFHRMSPSLCLNIAYFTSELLQRHWLCLGSAWDYHWSIGYHINTNIITSVGSPERINVLPKLGVLKPTRVLSSQSSNPVAVGTDGLPNWMFWPFLRRNSWGFRRQPKRGVKWGERSCFICNPSTGCC